MPSSLRSIGEKTSTNSLFEILGGIRYLVFMPLLDKIIVSVHVEFNVIIPNPTDEYVAELERLKINVDSESQDPADKQFLVGMQHIDGEDGLVCKTTHVTVRKGYIVAYRRLVTAAGRNRLTFT